MEALEFLKEERRMCEFFEEGCVKCLLRDTKCRAIPGVADAELEKEVAIVEQWSKAHPRRTRQSVFLKMFPHVILNDKGQPGFCPKMLDTEYKPVGGCVLDVDICQRCMDKFWGQEVD